MSMATAFLTDIRPIQTRVGFRSVTKQSPETKGRIRCAVATPKKRYTIAVLPGDGIGSEVIPVATDVLRLAGSLEGIEFDLQEMPVGGAACDLVGVPLPQEVETAVKLSDAVLLGAVGGPKWDHLERLVRPEAGLQKIRVALNVYTNLRPITVYPQLLDASSLKNELADGVDLMIVRELTGGLYSGQPRGFRTDEKGEVTAFATEVYSESEIDRVARVGYETAKSRLGKLCSVDKASFVETSMLWRRRVTQLGSEYPSVKLSHFLVDTFAMELLRDPKKFDTILTNNVFGDILSDVAAMITGGIGMLPSACLGDSGPGLFEPVHGSAPDIDGQDIANPLASMLTVVMLLKYGLKEEKVAKRIEDAVSDTLTKGFRTRDIHTAGTKLVGCKRMGEEILKSLDAKVPAPM